MTQGLERAAVALPRALAPVAHQTAIVAGEVGDVAGHGNVTAAIGAAASEQQLSAPAADAKAGALRIGLLGNGDLSWGSQMVHDRLVERGHVPVYMPFGSFTSDAAGNISSAGARVERLDSLMVRVGGRMTDDGMAALRRVEASEVPLLSSPGAIELARDKWTIATTLKAAGLPHPTTALITKAHTGDDVRAALELLGGGSKPLVIKPAGDMGGHGVVFQERSSQISMRSVADALMDGNTRTRLVAQEWVKEGTGSDLRAYFVRRPDGSIHIPELGIVRTGEEGKGQANLSAGGSWAALKLDGHVRDMAQRGADKFGLDFGSVDFVKSGDGYTVIEVNAAAGIEREITDVIGPLDHMLADLAIDAAHKGSVTRGGG